jgi:hypothetical protein
MKKKLAIILLFSMTLLGVLADSLNTPDLGYESIEKIVRAGDVFPNLSKMVKEPQVRFLFDQIDIQGLREMALQENYALSSCLSLEVLRLRDRGVAFECAMGRLWVCANPSAGVMSPFLNMLGSDVSYSEFCTGLNGVKSVAPKTDEAVVLIVNALQLKHLRKWLLSKDSDTSSVRLRMWAIERLMEEETTSSTEKEMFKKMLDKYKMVPGIPMAFSLLFEVDPSGVEQRVKAVLEDLVLSSDIRNQVIDKFRFLISEKRILEKIAVKEEVRIQYRNILDVVKWRERNRK